MSNVIPFLRPGKRGLPDDFRLVPFDGVDKTTGKPVFGFDAIQDNGAHYWTETYDTAARRAAAMRYWLGSEYPGATA